MRVAGIATSLRNRCLRAPGTARPDYCTSSRCVTARPESLMKIHFLLVKDFFKGGGIEAYTRAVGSQLVKRGHEVTVYSTGTREGAPSSWEGINIVWLPKTRPYWAEKFCGALMASYMELNSGNPDIVHLHSVAAGAMAAVLRYRRAPCLVQMHGVEWKRSRWGAVAQFALKSMEQCSVACGDAFTAVSKTQCDYYFNRYGIHCEYIPTATYLKESVSPRLILDLGLRPRECVLFASRLVPEKGAHYLIPAFRRLQTNYSLAIAGAGANSDSYQRRLFELAGSDRRIRFLGDVRGVLLEELFSNAAVFVQPSEVEGLSIGLIEAMSYGLQCVASDIPENREVIGEAGLLFRSKDTDDLQRVLNGTMEDRTSAAEIGARARCRVAELFSWDLVVDQLEGLYARVASDGRRRRVA
jgi:glycosyltransferase involved in cell wall biosynthesis